MVCRECLPQCDGCGLPLIPSSPVRSHNKLLAGQKKANDDDKEESSNSAVAEEEAESEVVIERNRVMHRYHKRCVLSCGSCKQPVQRKRGKIYKKLVSLDDEDPLQTAPHYAEATFVLWTRASHGALDASPSARSLKTRRCSSPNHQSWPRPDPLLFRFAHRDVGDLEKLTVTLITGRINHELSHYDRGTAQR